MKARGLRSWRAALAIAGVLALMVIAACGGGGSGDSGSTGETPTQSEETAPPDTSATDTTNAGGDETLVVAITNTPPDLDTASSAQFVENEINSAVYDRLWDFAATEGNDGDFVMDTQGVAPIEAKLAESWEESADKKTYTITLRKGVKSPLGNDLTIEDVRYTLDRGLSLKQNGTFYLGGISFTSMDNFKAIDDYTFSMTLDQPNVLFYKIMAIPLLAILDSAEFKKHATDEDPWATEWARTNNAGFGPYQMIENTPGQQVVLKANPNYWNGVPEIKSVIMREVPDSANRAALVKGGDVDVAEYLTARERESLQGDANVRVVSFQPAQQKSVLWMTNTIKPFDNKLVRQAVCWALPYDDIVSAVTVGSGQRQFGVLPANYEFYDPETYPYSYDPEKAKQLLEQAGLGDGFDTEIAFSTAAPEDEQQMEIVAQALGQIGINAQLRKLPFAAFNEGWLGGKYPMGTLFEGAFVPDYTYALRLWYYDPDLNFLNYMNYNNPEVNSLLDQALATFDDVKRQELATEIQRLINDDAPVCTMIEPGVHYAVGKNVSGVNYYTYSALHFDLMSKS